MGGQATRANNDHKLGAGPMRKQTQQHVAGKVIGDAFSLSKRDCEGTTGAMIRRVDQARPEAAKQGHNARMLGQDPGLEGLEGLGYRGR